ncbi:hypothetical protein ACFV1L_17135 [Kitasatospora sp. NPDC059646]|uniref:hypothetical protein n=1 Tax=Kitasatospora sp. NPDC059646 TaxID=3346893 RepID=UPI0036A700C5
MFTTPDRPLDVLAAFPELASRARRATRLHPRRGIPAPGASSVAGPLLWPEDEPWPTCGLAHVVEVERPATPEDREDARRSAEQAAAALARINATFEQAMEPFSAEAADPGSALAAFTAHWYDTQRTVLSAPQEQDRTTVTTEELVTPEQPVPLLPVVQLHAADIPETPFPDSADLVQLLWCPLPHRSAPGLLSRSPGPAPLVVWRAAAALSRSVGARPPVGALDGFVLEQCVVRPEGVTEFPCADALPEPLRSRVLAWDEAQEAGSGPTYRRDLSVAPGMKTGGWPVGPRRVQCDCGSGMGLFLTIPDDGDGAHSWTPLEERARTARHGHDPEFDGPTGFDGAWDELVVFLCERDPRHQVRLVVE